MSQSGGSPTAFGEFDPASVYVNGSVTPKNYVLFGNTEETLRRNLASTLHSGRIADKQYDLSVGCEPVFKFTSELPMFQDTLKMSQRPEKANIPHKFTMAWVCMTPEESIEAQYAANQVFKGEDPNARGIEQWLRGGVEERKTEPIRDGLESGELVVPAPTLEFDRLGNLRGRQEGRNRSYVAREMGLDRINVLFALSRDKFDGYQ